MKKQAIARFLLLGACMSLALGCHYLGLQRPSGQSETLPWPTSDGLLLKVSDLNPSNGRLMPAVMGDKKIHHGGFQLFKPGQIAHPEPRHVHDAAEVFIIVQGKGILPIEGKEFPVKAGDVAVVKANKDHHLRSSVEDPLVVAWFVMDK